jgi:hypothetical protein
MSEKLDTLLLLALPASGKSEVRRYLASLDSAECERAFGIGETVQLDDFPYVHLWRRISQEARKRGHDGVFFLSDALTLREPGDWGTLTTLLDEDYRKLVKLERHAADNAAQWLFERIDRARTRVGLPPALAPLPAGLRAAIGEAIEAETRALLTDLQKAVPDSLDGRTVVLEFARGGADGSELPLPKPYGYKYALSLLDPALLRRAAILYIWVTPEESRRKNIARTDPNDPGSILHHGVPQAVMYGDYGCDDIGWLLEHSDQPNTLRIEAHGEEFHLPIGRFDNRVDRTTFIREEPSAWKAEDVANLRAGMEQAFREIEAGRKALGR